MSGWAAAIPYIVSAASAIYGASASKKAGDKAAKGSDQAVAEQRRQYDTTLALLEPERAMGYGAMSDLSKLYGWTLPAYQSAGSISGSAGTTGSIAVNGRRADGSLSGANPGGLLPGNKTPGRKFPAEINLDTGTVTLPYGVKNAAARSDLATRYLRGEDVQLGKKFKRIKTAIDEAKYNGYSYSPPDPNAVPYSPVTNHMVTDQSQTDTMGTAGDMSGFFTAPDYTFRLGEGAKTVQQSAANRGGLFSGNTGRALTSFGSGVAAGEYGNYVNRLLAAAGLGQSATNTTVVAGTNAANSIGNSYQNAADYRASGVMGQANTITGAANSGLNAWLLSQYNKGG